ncbi:MAG: aminotransferase class I/II-fold pyridoxal phosphate-dependent enzyme [Candidatus Thermoplasmatota archaeon]|nr:aminotransferase class I/II-fold pyridoxal phosphate-dependent enzyme [Candidatus Thermoplasmatota archaeon]
MDERKKDILSLVKKHLYKESQKSERLYLISTTFDDDEIVEAIDSLLSTNLTMGKKVELFEKKWSEYLNKNSRKEIASIMVNSGSSANLLALSFLMDGSIDGHMVPGDEVIVPPVTWSTTIFPIIQLGLKPVFVDVDLETMTISTERIMNAITEKTKAIMPVHLLGNPCKMNDIMKIAKDNDLFVIEDCCEAHGAMYDGQYVGTFGDLSTFSYFYSHHITTIEGGMVCTNNKEWLSLIRSYRAHGWVREREDRKELVDRYSEIDPRFLFVSLGYNLRPTEINGAFGIHQVDKLEGFIEKRINNHKQMLKILEKYSDYFILPKIMDNTRHSAFAFGLIVKNNEYFDKKEIQSYLESRMIETRPIAGSNLLKQPAMNEMDCRVVGDMTNSDIIHNNGFWIGNHPMITDEQLSYLERTVDEFMTSRIR